MQSAEKGREATVTYSKKTNLRAFKSITLLKLDMTYGHDRILVADIGLKFRRSKSISDFYVGETNNKCSRIVKY